MPGRTPLLQNNPTEPSSEIRSLRARLQDVIADTDDSMLAPLMEALKPLEMKMLKPPEAGLIMMKVKSSHGTVFHLGEVLVTQAQVIFLDRTGYGCCIGERIDGAVALACLDALGWTAHPGRIDGIQSAIHRICQEVLRKRESEAQIAAVTQVDFRSMAEE
jgi:alpha-D-ribose 1-methylphosphonate 5-triphosphate synthase subunit PhnG